MNFLGAMRPERGILRTLPRIIGNTRVLKSLSQGAIVIGATASATASISPAVDINHSILIHSGTSETANQESVFVRLELTNSNTVTAFHQAGQSANCTVSFVVLEFWPGVLRSVQRGTITHPTSGSAGIAQGITSVNTAKTAVMSLGSQQDHSSPGFMVAEASARLTLASATVITSNIGVSPGANVVVGYQVVEFW